MRFCKPVLVLPLVLCLATTTLADDDEMQDVSPTEVITEWVEAFNKNDPDLQSAFYEQSEEIEVLVSSGFHYRGYAEVREACEKDQEQLRYYDSTADDISTRIIGDTALVSFEHRYKIRFKEDDSRWQVHIRTTSVLERIDGEWKIVLEHSSSIRGVDRVTRVEE